MSSVPGKAPALRFPPQVETARDLLVAHLGKLLTIEETLAKRVLPELAREVKDEELLGAVREHLAETRGHVDRVKEAFAKLEEEPSGQPAVGLDGLRVEHDSLVPEIVPSMRSGVHCEAAMGTEHYEINAYEAAIRLADALSLGEVGELLRANLDEEVAALEQLATHADRLAKLAVEERAIR